MVQKAHASLGDLTPNNVGQLKTINSVLFPIFYNEKFYKNALESGELAKLAYLNDCTIGAVCCRREPVAEGSKDVRIYIMTLGVLAPYRRLGVGTLLLNHILEQCEKDKTVRSVYLHVQSDNDEAVKFYERHGFAIARTEESYYKRIEPASAHVLEKVIRK